MTFRLPRVASLAILALIAAATFALAQEPVVSAANPVVDEGGFWETLLVRLLRFPPDSRGLLDLLRQPRYAIPAFIAVNLIVFVETGLLVGFFLPGDSLLVIVGWIAFLEDWNLPLLLTSVSLAAIVGDTLGYSIGYKAGPKIFNREKSFFFKKDHLLAAQAFYERHGGKTIILARFIPILRTFAPVVAGVGQMQYKRFLLFNVVGGIGWVASMILIGYYLPARLNEPLGRLLGNPDFDLKDHVEKVVIVIVFLSILPGIVVWLKNKLTGKVAEPTEALVAK